MLFGCKLDRKEVMTMVFWLLKVGMHQNGDEDI